MSTKPKTDSAFKRETLKAHFETQRDLEVLHRAVQCLVGQNRELIQRCDKTDAQHAAERSTWSTQHSEMLARLDCVIAANNGLGHENDALLKALGLKALKAMSAPIHIDKATILRLIQSTQAQELSGAPFNPDDLARSLRERDLPLHRNSGN